MRNLVELLSNIVQQYSRWLFAILRQELEVELCGYIVAVNEKHIVTAFHKICDDCFRDHFQSADSTDDFLFQEACNTESNEPIVSQIIKNVDRGANH
jgi:hypothetical protein